MLEQEEGLSTKIILASASPRRKQIFEIMGLDFETIIPVDCHEESGGDPYETVKSNSIAKVDNVFKGLRSRKSKVYTGKKDPRFLISGFDTIVSVNNRILGKPSDQAEAYEFISMLAGKMHKVISGVCVLDCSTGKSGSSSGTTEVWFRELTESEIGNYISQNDVLDKAGAYNITGPGMMLVEKINGCFYNVAGIPVFKYIGLLKSFNYKIL